MGNQIHLFKEVLYILARVSNDDGGKDELFLKADTKHQLLSSCYQLEDITSNPVDIHIEDLKFTVEDPTGAMM